MAHHELFEWESRGFEGDLAIPVAEAGALAHAAAAPAKRLTGSQRAFEFGRETLKAQNLVGMVVTAGASCEILPKVDRNAEGNAPLLRRQLIRMLAVAHDLPIADDAATMTDTQHHTLLEVLIRRFVKLLSEAVRQGVPRSYVAHADDLPALRGQLDVLRQFTTLAASPQRLACRYDEFSEDIALNQVMNAAIARLRQLACSTDNQRGLAELALVYAEVAAVPTSQLRWDRIVPDRTNARWQGLLRLARLILGDRFQNSVAGAADGFALLFDMNVLFERYVEKLIAPIAASQDWQLRVQGGLLKCLFPEDGAGAIFKTKPDIRLIKGEDCGMVIDTKWKALVDRSAEAKMDVSQSDVYQMMAYAQLYRCNRIVLLYPHHAGLPSPMLAHHRIVAKDAKVRLTIAAIDLTNHASARNGLESLIGSITDEL